jgi:hypothetical protein
MTHGAGAISLARPGRLDAELAGADVAAELRRYTVRQLLIAVPLLVLVLGVVQAAMCSRPAGAPRPSMPVAGKA